MSSSSKHSLSTHVPDAAQPGITCWRDGELAQVCIHNLPRFNAMTRGMWRQLREVFTQLQREAGTPGGPRAVVVQGAQGHFCAGGDISEYPAFRFDEASLRAFHEDEVWGGLGAMLACDLPLVAAIAGNCMGAGVEIASCCDIRLASPGAKFGAPIAKLGFPMAPRELQLVGSALGTTVARAMLLEAAIYTAPELLRAGFLTRLVGEGADEADSASATHNASTAVASAARASALRMASLSPQAARLHKQSLRALAAGDQGLQALLPQAYAYANSAEHREGITAFLAKRPPAF